MSQSKNSSNDSWSTVESPTEKTLHDVVIAGGTAYAVGEGGYFLIRHSGRWKPVLERGPKVDSNALLGAAVSDDGEHVWLTGDSGVLARYKTKKDDDIGSRQLVDFSRTYDVTTTWKDVVITGSAGQEQILLYNASGEVLVGKNDRGSLSWGETIKPGSGSSLSGFGFVDRDTGYACDTSGAIYETINGGESFEMIGAEEAPALNDIYAANSETVTVAAANGDVLTYNGTVWTEQYVGEEELSAIDVRQTSSTGIICGSNGGIYSFEQNKWAFDGTPVNEQLNSIVIGSNDSAFTVGTNGTIIER